MSSRKKKRSQKRKNKKSKTPVPVASNELAAEQVVAESASSFAEAEIVPVSDVESDVSEPDEETVPAPVEGKLESAPGLVPGSTGVAFSDDPNSTGELPVLDLETIEAMKAERQDESESASKSTLSDARHDSAEESEIYGEKSIAQTDPVDADDPDTLLVSRWAVDPELALTNTANALVTENLAQELEFNEFLKDSEEASEDLSEDPRSQSALIQGQVTDQDMEAIAAQEAERSRDDVDENLEPPPEPDSPEHIEEPSAKEEVAGEPASDSETIDASPEVENEPETSPGVVQEQREPEDSGSDWSDLTNILTQLESDDTHSPSASVDLDKSAEETRVEQSSSLAADSEIDVDPLEPTKGSSPESIDSAESYQNEAELEIEVDEDSTTELPPFHPEGLKKNGGNRESNDSPTVDASPGNENGESEHQVSGDEAPEISEIESSDGSDGELPAPPEVSPMYSIAAILVLIIFAAALYFVAFNPTQ